MKKNYNLTLKLKFFILALVSLLCHNINAQCTTGNLFPLSTYTPTYDGTLQDININAYAGEYCLMNFEANKTFTFSTSVATDYITITNNAGDVIYASGLRPLNYNSGPNPGILRYYIHKSSSCDVESVSRTRSVRAQNLIDCSPPSDFTVSNIKNTTVRISWSLTTTLPEYGYSIYVTTNNTPPTSTSVANYFSPYPDKVLFDLTPSTTYNYWVKTSCTLQISSPWTYGGSFKTTDDCKKDVLGQYPTSLVTNTCVPFGAQNNPPNVVATDSYAGEYYMLDASAGSMYVFESSNLSDYITVTDEFGEFVLSGGKSPLKFPANSFKIRVYTNSDAQCGSEQVNRTISVRCSGGNPITGAYSAPIRNLEVNEITSTSANVKFSYIVTSGFAPILTYFNTSNYQDLASNPIAGAVTINLDTLPSSSVNLTNLLPNTVYYFNIIQGTSIGNYDAYRIVFKTKSSGICYSPSGLAVENINFTSASLKWNYSTPLPANGYQYYINTTNTPPNAGTTPTGTTTNTTVFLSGLTSNTLYYYWVRTNCGSGIGDWIGSNFKTVGTALCTAPTSLAATAITGSSASLNWTAPLSIPSQGYQYYYNTTNVSPLSSTNANGSTTATYAVITGLLPETTYYFWIRSNCGSSQGSWVSGGSFTTTVLCFAPTQVTGDAISDSQATISWIAANPSPNNGYQYYLTPNNPIPGVSTPPTGSLTNTSTTVSGLSADTEYYLWVRSNCGSSVSTWVFGGSFSTYLGPDCGSPSNLSISNITTNSAQFSWNSPIFTPAFGYQYYYNTSNVSPLTTTTPIGTSPVATNKVITGLSSQTTYYFWVRSNCDSSQSTWVSGGSFTTTGTTVCNSPILASTSNITTNSVTIIWEAANPVPSNGYQYYYGTTIPANDVIPSGSTVGNSVTITGLSSGTLYYAYVRSNCGSSQGIWRSAGSFTTLSSGCDLPYNMTVINSFSTSSLIQWQAPTPNPSNGYQYYYSTNATIPTSATIPSGITTSAIVNLTGLISGTTYYFWVRSNCGSQQSNWSSVTSLTTLCSLVTNPIDSNPTTSSIQLSWGLQYPAAAPANGYDYFISINNSTPSSTITPTGITTTTNVTVTTGLVPYTTYYYWVRSNCGNDTTSWISGGSFITSDVVCNVPALPGTSNITSNSATISWSAPNPVPSNGYQYYYSTSSTNPTSTTTPTGNVTATSFILSGLSINTLYNVWIRSNCGNGQTSTWRKISFTTTLSCASPSNIIATNITSDSAIISWTPIAVAPSTGYQLYYNTSNVAPLDSYNTTADVFSSSSRYVTIFSPNTTYYVWVRSICGTETSSWISGSFTTPPLLNCNGAFYGLYPENTFTPSCSGSSETIVTNAYAGEYSNVNVVSNKQYTFSSSNTSDYITITNATGSVLLANGLTPVVWQSGNYNGLIRYFIHNNANCGNGNANRIRNIVCTNTLDNLEFNKNEFVLFPNPVTDILNISFNKEISRVSIFNIIGQEVITKSLNKKEGTIDVSHLSSGNYLVKVTVNGLITTLKLIKK